MFERLGLIGCGLMGGSFALALRQAGLVRQIAGFSASPTTTQRALELGVIDVQADSAAEAAAGADLVLVAVPVAATEATFAAIRSALGADTLLMDVGSTKSDVVAAAERALGPALPCFVPAHPIAGKERSGVDHADAALYQGRHVILTPMATSGARQLALAQEVWAAIGARLVEMTPAAHDTTFAAVSHLPHLLAFAFIDGIARQPGGAAILALGGPGFRDFTRIAAADPRMWRDVLLANRQELLDQLRHHRQALAQFEQLIEAGDGAALEQRIAQASDTRAAWHMDSFKPGT
ncbi:prephenate dehydrogenase/arogenate dehydrogenase family protein [Pseudorhodoferax sp. Leaf274]|uniref:prephenate dehydrogenase n=1 Tax=Pseudorhodoferax sp. Leaf274 TaxID=1736318 RepID=UPI000703192E|nr:prephenate dehydrogenase/arogenate dehydrogenase family protein [Pseudorhodoferax sp. Leaf274]KQP43134.1 prephenate dehydrogenase [Pseudorhodoferax sp. Leaf274]